MPGIEYKITHARTNALCGAATQLSRCKRELCAWQQIGEDYRIIGLSVNGLGADLDCSIHGGMTGATNDVILLK